MTQKSYLWDGTITGDATDAPYDKDEFNTFMLFVQSTDNTLNTLFTVPSFLNDLRIYSDETGMSVIVDSGAAIMGGRRVFTSDTSVTLNIDSIQTAGYFRYDYIILRADSAAQTVRLAVLKGSETNSETTLIVPTLTQTAFIREIPLALVYVDDSESYVQDKYVYDMRVFATNYYTTNAYKLSNRNIVVNSEFMAFSDMAAGLVPIEWESFTVITANTKLTKMSRGFSAGMDATGIGEGKLYQVIPIYPDQKTFTVKGIFKDTTGGSTPYVYAALYPCTLEGTILPGTFKKQQYTNKILDTETTFEFTVTLDDNSLMKAVILMVACTETADIGQCMVVPGYHPGPFREFNETLMFRKNATAAAWSDTAKSTGTTLIDLNASYDVPNRVKGVYVRLRGRDSGSAAGVASIQLQGYVAPYDTVYGVVELDGITNDVYRESQFYVPVDAPIYNAQDETPQLRVGVVATGAGLFDATVDIVGIVT